MLRLPFPIRDRRGRTRKGTTKINGKYIRCEVPLHGPPPECKCKCGNPTSYSKQLNKWNAYLRGGHSAKGRHWTASEETRRKHSERQLGPKNHMYGRRVSEEIKSAQSNRMSGINNPRYGIRGELHPLFGKPGSTTGMKFSAEVNRKKGSPGSRNGMYGKPAAKGTGRGKGSYCLKGHWVRSSWEREVADWFFNQNIQYEYEPKRFNLGGGLYYWPDFYLPEANIYYEVKGYFSARSNEQIKRFRLLGHTLHVIDGDSLKLFKVVA